MSRNEFTDAVLTDICQQLLDEGLSHEEVTNLAADIPGEFKAMADNRAEAACPDMYGALLAAKVVIGMMERPAGMGEEVIAALDKRLSQIDAALAKAGGRISAAPDMYEALRMCLLNGNLDCQERGLAEAALAKAEGRS